MIDNAVAHYEHLTRVQEVPAERAFEHARLLYGVPEPALRERLAGRVAAHDATLAALSEAREQLVDGCFRRPPLTVLRDLYEAVTGEDTAEAKAATTHPGVGPDGADGPMVPRNVSDA